MQSTTEDLPVVVRYRKMSFDRAARTYDSVSTVQRGMAKRLVQLSVGPLRPRSVLELGCGTGHLSVRLFERFPGSEFLLTDISVSMLERARVRLGTRAEAGQVRCLQLDASSRPWGMGQRYELMASNALVQWFPNLAEHFAAAAEHLQLGGSYLVSGFLGDNLPELARSLQRFDVPPAIGHSAREVRDACAAAGLELSHFEEGCLREEYESSRTFFEVIRVMGASRYPERGPLPRAVLLRLVEDYGRRNATGAGVVATWRPWFALLRKSGGQLAREAR
jgi:malonyl-CoA O-methyltransferase